jgi:uracil-DNA glycosylase
MSKIKKVIFVGDEPSRFNADPQIAFVGAKCFPRLVEWIKIIQPDYYIVMNSNKMSDLETIRKLVNEERFCVISLGLHASCRLSKLEINHFPIPHPSGRNRLTNDIQSINDSLMKAKEYVG